MANTGGERITDTFQFKHHALPVPEITATNRIIDVTIRLTATIAGIQEEPPNEMKAIQSLCTLLYAKVAPFPPPASSIIPTPPVITPTVEDKLVTIWNPQEVQTSLPPHKHKTPHISPNSITPAIIQDNSDNDTPTPVQSTHPSQPLQEHPLTLNQMRPHIANIISCVIADELMPTPSLLAHQTSLHHGYAFAAQSILLDTTSPPSHSTINFIGANIDNNTGNVLEYRHLMKMEEHKHIWAHGFAHKLGQLLWGIRNVAGTDTCFCCKPILLYHTTILLACQAKARH
jgi:hypothetical protein